MSPSRRLFAVHGRSIVGSGLLLSALGLLWWSCLQPPISLTAPQSDAGGSSTTPTADGSSAAIAGLFTISGCTQLSFPAAGPLCISDAPASLRLHLLAVGAAMHRFQIVRLSDSVLGDGGVRDLGLPDAAGSPVDGGDGSLLDEASSRAESPTVTLSRPGTYQVSLGVAGPGGTATAIGTIYVLPVALGAGCSESEQCASHSCLCGRGTTCPGALNRGLCSLGCDGTPCPSGTTCMDLSRSKTGSAAMDTWRLPQCVPVCGSDVSCRPDFLCRELPILKSGEKAGGAYAFGRACFAAQPGDVGASCTLPDSTLDPTACALGTCLSLGLRGVCSAACSSESDCPSTAACAAFGSASPPAPPAPRCLARCDATHPCSDPLLACQAAGGSGGLGFALPGAAAGVTVCAPKRCSTPTDCPGGACTVLGTASFCTR
jgi:PKD repeat protein